MDSMTSALPADEQRATVVQIGRRLLPLIFAGYVLAYLDRVNIGFAQLGMGTELGIKAAAYGLAAAIFFIAYFIFEVPSNLLMRRFGARIWIARIMITWGLVTVITGFVTSYPALVGLRFLLGVAEAGFFPGMIFYLTQWFRANDRSVALGWFILAQPTSFILGGLCGGVILDHAHWFGLGGWRWLFVLTGVPAMLIGIVTLVLLPNSPKSAAWLSPRRRDWLLSELDAEQGPEQAHGARQQLAALRNPRVLHLAAIYLMLCTGSYGFTLFLPLIIKQINPGYSATKIGWTAVVPFLFAALAILVVARMSRVARERRYYVIAAAVLAAVGLTVVVVYRGSPGVAMVGLCLAGIGGFAFLPPFWAMATTGMSRAHAAVGVAVVNSIGNLGGFAGPYLVGQGASATGVTAGLLVPIGAEVLAVVLLLAWRSPARQPGSDLPALAARPTATA
jgi:ACS family tartrate transporter-like MFS transporter